MTDAQLVQYYVDLLIIQYRSREKAPEHMRAFLENLTIYELIRAVEYAYNIDEDLGPVAIGAQLDIIAKYVGANRIVTGFDFDRTFWGMVDYNEAEPYINIAGLIQYSEASPPDAQILKYDTDQQSLYALTDSELLIMIKLKIAQNNSNHSTYEIDLILAEFFPGSVIFTDELNMTISYIFDTDVQRIVEIAQAENAIPKPAAVGLLLNFVPDINNIFGLGSYDSDTIPDFVQGFNQYSEEPFGSFLTY